MSLLKVFRRMPRMHPETGRSDSGRSACGPTSQRWLAARRASRLRVRSAWSASNGSPMPVWPRVRTSQQRHACAGASEQTESGRS